MTGIPALVSQTVDLGCDAYGRRVTMTRRKNYDGKILWKIESDPVSQRDDGERMDGLTDENVGTMFGIRGREWQPMASAPKDGRWIIACCWDGFSIYRVSWGRNREGELRWCSATKSFGDLFGVWIECPQTKPKFNPAEYSA